MKTSSVGPSRDPIIVQSDVDAYETMQEDASFWQQLKATIVRNLLRKKRNKRQVFRETFTPVYYLALIILMKYVIPTPTYPAISTPQGSSSLLTFPILKWKSNDQ